MVNCRFEEATSTTGARVCLRSSNSPSLQDLALRPLISCLCPMQVNSALQKLLSSSTMNPPQARDASNFCEGRDATHQPPNACAALWQDKGLCLTHFSLGQMSEKSLLSLFWLNHQYTKKLHFHRSAGKNCI